MKEVIGKIDGVNKGLHFSNISVLKRDNTLINIKLEKEELDKLEIGKVYLFKYNEVETETKINNVLVEVLRAEEALDKDTLEEVMNEMYTYAPISMKDMRKEIEEFLNQIENEYIKIITNELYKKYEGYFYTHPAATKFHHAYVGGLAHHTLTMLKMAEPFLSIYPYLNKDLLYSGILIHDMSKIDEMTGVDGEYTKEGQLLGHLVMIAIEIDRIAEKHNISDKEEVMLLKHIGVSHHGIPNYGAARRPQTGEALLIWYLDTIDSKFGPLGDAYNETLPGEHTQNIPALERQRFYRSKFNNEK